MSTQDTVGTTHDPDQRTRWRARQIRAAAVVLQTYARSLSEQPRGRRVAG